MTQATMHEGLTKAPSGATEPQAPARPITSPEVAVPRAGVGVGTIVRRMLALAFLVVQALLVLRIGLLALGADQNRLLIALIAQAGAGLEAPFQGVLQTGMVTIAGSAIDLTAFVALLGWTLLQGALVAILSLGTRSQRW